MIPTRPPIDFQYYQGAVYWNNFSYFSTAQNRAVSENNDTGWIEHTVAKYGRRPRTLIINCGNGWVERAFHSLGGVETVVGFDILESNVEAARREAHSNWIYLLGDCNTIGVLGEFDMIVNCGAMHHVAKIERLTGILADSLAPDGIYVSYDYVGPHRNQFGWESWSKSVLANNALPPKYRVQMRYPHMITMLATDPTEAIHSELQIEIMQQHFDIVERADMGGGIAYMVLFQNRGLFADQGSSEAQALIEKLYSDDHDELARDPASNLFSSIVARRRENCISHHDRLLRLQLEEARETRALANGGRYYPPTPLEIIYNDLADAEWKLRAMNINS